MDIAVVAINKYEYYWNFTCIDLHTLRKDCNFDGGLSYHSFVNVNPTLKYQNKVTID